MSVCARCTHLPTKFLLILILKSEDNAIKPIQNGTGPACGAWFRETRTWNLSLGFRLDSLPSFFSRSENAFFLVVGGKVASLWTKPVFSFFFYDVTNWEQCCRVSAMLSGVNGELSVSLCAMKMEPDWTKKKQTKNNILFIILSSKWNVYTSFLPIHNICTLKNFCTVWFVKLLNVVWWVEKKKKKK